MKTVDNHNRLHISQEQLKIDVTETPVYNCIGIN